MPSSSCVQHVISDLEGRLAFLEKSLERINRDWKEKHPRDNGGKDIIEYKEAKDLKQQSYGRLEIAPGHQLLHLGDVFDHGCYDEQLAMIFVNTVLYYEQYPIGEYEPMVLVAGNRDFNKTRFHHKMEMNVENIQYRFLYDDSSVWTILKSFSQYFFELLLDSEEEGDGKFKCVTGAVDGDHIHFQLEEGIILETIKSYKGRWNQVTDVTKKNSTLAGFTKEAQAITLMLYLLLKHEGMQIMVVNGEGEYVDCGIERETIGKYQHTALGIRFTQQPTLRVGQLKPILHQTRIQGLTKNHACMLLLYLKWMLTNSMTCGKDPSPAMAFQYSTFENHRIECYRKDQVRMNTRRIASEGIQLRDRPTEIEYRKAKSEISDYRVMNEMFLDPINLEGGYYHLYLGCSKVAYRRGEALFAHGGFTMEGMTVNGLRPKDVDSWVKAINAKYSEFYKELFRKDREQMESAPNKYPPICRGVTQPGVRTARGPDGKGDGLKQLIRLLLQNNKQEKIWNEKMEGKVSREQIDPHTLKKCGFQDIQEFNEFKQTVPAKPVLPMFPWLSWDFDPDMVKQIKTCIFEDGQATTVIEMRKRAMDEDRWIPSIDMDVVDFMYSNGVKHLVCGHHPIGDSPIGVQFRQLRNGGNSDRDDDFVYVYDVDITRCSFQDEAVCAAIFIHSEDGVKEKYVLANFCMKMAEHHKAELHAVWAPEKFIHEKIIKVELEIVEIHTVDLKWDKTYTRVCAKITKDLITDQTFNPPVKVDIFGCRPDKMGFTSNYLIQTSQ